MPYHKTSWKFGNLFILFKVKFPDVVTKADQDAFRACVENIEGQKPQELLGADSEVRDIKTLHKFDEAQRNKHS